MNPANILVRLVLFSIIDTQLKIFLINDNLPSAKLKQGRSLDATVQKIIRENTHIQQKDQYIEQLYTISTDENLGIVYYILVPEADTQGNEAAWKKYTDIRKTISDFPIISYALQRLQWKIEYTNVVYSLLPEEFTLSQLQNIYEAIFDKQLDKRNFRKKILSLNFLIPTGKKKIGNTRPAQIYTFRERKPMIIHVFS